MLNRGPGAGLLAAAEVALEGLAPGARSILALFLPEVEGKARHPQLPVCRLDTPAGELAQPTEQAVALALTVETHRRVEAESALRKIHQAMEPMDLVEAEGETSSTKRRRISRTKTGRAAMVVLGW